MTDRYVFSIDPGKSSGVVLGLVPENGPYERLEAFQVEGGTVGLVRWFRLNNKPVYHSLNTVRVCEKFTPLQNKGFAQTLDSTEPLRCEGALIAMGIMPDYDPKEPRWRRPDRMYMYGGKDKKEKLKNARAFLKDNRMHLTGSMVGCKDADDAISATLHGISYAAQVLKSKETFNMVANWAVKRGA